MAHKRTPEAELTRAQKKAAKDYVIKYSFNDTIKDEAISRTEPYQVQAFLLSTFGFCNQSAVPCSFGGVVLSDSYGNGVHQNRYCEECGCLLTPFNITGKKDVFLCRKCGNGVFQK